MKGRHDIPASPVHLHRTTKSTALQLCGKGRYCRGDLRTHQAQYTGNAAHCVSVRVHTCDPRSLLWNPSTSLALA
ncbi:hypothetical protein GBA52_014927 [Prunus armeniaca]|nr:hypothetical protein GBA52_014927 [Prunus armeniaca]